MLQLQQEDPALTHVFAALRDDPTDNVIHEPAQQHHYGYKYILQPGQALRVQQLLLDRTVNALAPIPVVLPATLQRPAIRFLHEGLAHIGTVLAWPHATGGLAYLKTLNPTAPSAGDAPSEKHPITEQR